MMMIQTQVDMGESFLLGIRLYSAPSRSYNARDRNGSFVPASASPSDRGSSCSTT